ncbi:MAG: hypothetical protein MUO82_01990 [Candidatus Thermoplasmatota archaeon]|nr:hypothetical protein [Candidatus Thermoplasmatota archaeon]
MDIFEPLIKSEKEKIIKILNYLSKNYYFLDKKYFNKMNEYAIFKGTGISQPTINRLMCILLEQDLVWSNKLKENNKRSYNIHNITFKGCLYLYKNIDKKIDKKFNEIIATIEKMISVEHDKTLYFNIIFFSLLFDKEIIHNCLKKALDEIVKNISFDFKWNYNYIKDIMEKISDYIPIYIIDKYCKGETLVEKLEFFTKKFTDIKIIEKIKDNKDIILVMENEIERLESNKFYIDFKIEMYKELLEPIKNQKTDLRK